MLPPKSLRLHWDAETGWVLDVPWMMPEAVVRRTVKFSLPKQVDRWRSLPIGAKKDELKTAIQKLERFEVQQKVVGARGDGSGDLVVFSGTKN